MNLHEINSLNLVQLLTNQFGVNPLYKSEKSIWVKSPFRPNESTPSFHISKNYKYDIWFDHGNGLGGKIVDFYLHFLKTDLKGVLKHYNEKSFSFQKLDPIKIQSIVEHSRIEILKRKPVYSYVLKSYLKERGISSIKAYEFLEEINFKINNGSTQFALGFQNIEGKYELRNKIFKGCNGKNISLISKVSEDKRVFIFEGFFDFLSFMELNNYPEFNFVVMNSISNISKLIEYLDANKFIEIHLYLDNDLSGDNCTNEIILRYNSKVIDHRNEYKNFQDLNDFLIAKSILK